MTLIFKEILLFKGLCPVNAQAHIRMHLNSSVVLVRHIIKLKKYKTIDINNSFAISSLSPFDY